MDNPVSKNFPARVITFRGEDDGPESIVSAEIVDSGDGFVEVAFDLGKVRHYVAFRLSDFHRAIREYSP